MCFEHGKSVLSLAVGLVSMVIFCAFFNVEDTTILFLGTTICYACARCAEGLMEAYGAWKHRKVDASS